MSYSMEKVKEMADKIDELAGEPEAIRKIAGYLAGTAGTAELKYAVRISEKIGNVIFSDQLRDWPEEHAALLETIIPLLDLPSHLDARDRSVARVLEDQTASKKLRSSLWKAYNMNGTKLPYHGPDEKWDLPEALQDHYNFRRWLCAVKGPGWNDLQYTHPCLFKRDISREFKTDAEQKALDAIRRDSPGEFFLPLAIQGIELDKKYFIAALTSGATEIVFCFCENEANFLKVIPPRALMFYACANWSDEKALDFVRRLEKDHPGLVAGSLDESGHDALWYTLYRCDGYHKKLPDARKRGPLAEELIKLGCDPGRENCIGLCYNNIVPK